MIDTSASTKQHPCAGTRVLYERKCAAHQLSISTRTLDRLIGNKQLSARRIGRRLLIPHTELMRLARKDTTNI
jgi:excisionase family DNA binding protein